MHRLYVGLLYSLLFFMDTACHSLTQLELLQLQIHTLPVDKEIADKCSEYLQSKGFKGYKFVTLPQSLWREGS